MRLAKVTAVGFSLVSACAVACSVFTDFSSLDAAHAGDASSDASSASSDAAADATSTALTDGASTFDSGGAPFVRAFSKLPRTTPPPLTQTIARPSNAVTGDLLVLIVTSNDEYKIDTSSFAVGASYGFCPNINAYHAIYATKVDDGTATYEITEANSASNTYIEALLLAIGGAGSALDDVTSSNQDGNADNGATGAATPVTVQQAEDLVLVAFVADGPVTRSAPPGLTPVTSNDGIDLYAGVFPHGVTPSFIGTTTAAICWATLTMAIPPS